MFIGSLPLFLEYKESVFNNLAKEFLYKPSKWIWIEKNNLLSLMVHFLPITWELKFL